MTLGANTFQEIMQQPTLWQKTLEGFPQQHKMLQVLWRESRPKQVLWTGCGSAYFVGQTLAQLTQTHLALPSLAAPASEVSLHPQGVFYPKMKPLLVTLSRSGETSETLAAVNHFRAHYPGRPVLVITCQAESALAQAADVVLLADIQEKSVVQTASLSTMLLLGLLTLGLWAKAPPPAPLAEAGTALLTQYQRLALTLGSEASLERFFFLGGGALRGLANECLLKVKEMSLVQSEAFYPLEFRHGLGANAEAHSLVVGLLNPASAAHELAVLRDMQAQGARILTLGPDPLPNLPWEHVTLGGEGLTGWVLYLPFLQLLAYYRAVLVGRDTDHPTHLKAFIQLDDWA